MTSLFRLIGGRRDAGSSGVAITVDIDYHLEKQRGQLQDTGTPLS